MQGTLPHLKWLDLKGDGILHECAVMKTDPNGNIYFFKVEPLDGVDKKRLRDILVSRNANLFPLWDLMRQNRLGNGINALDYFHQLVRVLTNSGAIMEPQYGAIGARAVGKSADQMATESDFGKTNELKVGDIDTRTAAQKRAANSRKAK